MEMSFVNVEGFPGEENSKPPTYSSVSEGLNAGPVTGEGTKIYICGVFFN